MLPFAPGIPDKPGRPCEEDENQCCIWFDKIVFSMNDFFDSFHDLALIGLKLSFKKK